MRSCYSTIKRTSLSAPTEVYEIKLGQLDSSQHPREPAEESAHCPRRRLQVRHEAHRARRLRRRVAPARTAVRAADEDALLVAQPLRCRLHDEK